MTEVEAIKELSYMMASQARAILGTIAIAIDSKTASAYTSALINIYELSDSHIKAQWEKLEAKGEQDERNRSN